MLDGFTEGTFHREHLQSLEHLWSSRATGENGKTNVPGGGLAAPGSSGTSRQTTFEIKVDDRMVFNYV